MSRNRVMTTEKIERAIALRRKSWTIAGIAAELGVSAGAVRWQLLLAGAVDPPKLTYRLPAVPTEPREIRQRGRTVRLFTQEEDARLLAMEAEGLRDSEIARRLGRRGNSIRGRLITLARRDDREEAANA